MGVGVIDPRDYKGVLGKTGKFVSQKKDSQITIPKGPCTIPFLLHAYGVERITFQRKRKKRRTRRLQSKLDRRTVRKLKSVIENRELASSKFNAHFFYATEGAQRKWVHPISMAHI